VADKKVIFVAFAIEDKSARDLLRGQSLHTDCPIEYVDMSVKEPYDSEWKDRVRTRIRRSNGVIALVSTNTLTSTGEKWEIACAKEEKKPLLIFGIFQKCRAAKLVEPVGTDHLYFAEMQSKACQLTALGKLYHLMAKEGRL
jgi:MTH538 TIR-like domain (DUF1863)